MRSTCTNPILVTGSHRSGSTWVGRMVAKCPSIGYIHEPFNPAHRPGICGAYFHYWFTYVSDENSLFYFDHIKKCLNFKYQLVKELKVIKSTKDFVRLLRDFSRTFAYRALNKRPLVKDPIAAFSAEWLAESFNMDVIVLIRHPAAFAGSLKEACWSYPFSHFLQQPLLMEHHLYNYKSEIEEFTRESKDIIDQAILLWNLIHYMILKYKKRHQNWKFVRHEELSVEPVSEFGKLFESLGLDYSHSAQKSIAEHSSPTNHRKHNQLKRDSKSNVWSWQKRLTETEIIRIKEGTQDIAAAFYNAEDWGV